MRIPLFTSKTLASVVAAGFLFFACDPKGKSEEEVSETVSIDEEELNRSKAQIGEGLSQIKNWHSHWSNELGELGPEQFELMMTDSINPMEMPERNPILKDDPLFPYQFPHPAGNGTIDIYSYKVEAQDALDEPFLNPDSEVVWYREDGMKERLLFMGPSGMFEDGMWLNEQEFLVFGFFQEEVGYRPMAWLINVEDHELKQFRFSKVSQNYEPQSYINAKIKQVDLG
ncbi:hypothetical protein [Algoriphagus sp.]|uniref:hypothetical protein n=1 Tax=Algoriphagus sp. TaxID=1872435 RepID=UPI0032725ECF